MKKYSKSSNLLVGRSSGSGTFLFQQTVKHAPNKTAFFASRYFDIINLLFVAAFYRKGNPIINLIIIFNEIWSQFIISIMLEISYNISVLSFILKHPFSKGIRTYQQLPVCIFLQIIIPIEQIFSKSIIIQYFYASIPVLRLFFLMLGRHQLFECARQPRLSCAVKGIDKLNLLFAVF